MKLTDAKLRALRPADRPVRVADGRGLFIEIRPTGSKLWRLAYRFQGRQKLLALGQYPETSLAEARRRCSEAREHLAAGRDPSAVRQERAAAETPFASIAQAWFEHAAPGWSPRHRQTVRYRLDRYVLPRLASRPIAAVARADVLALIEALADRPETARRARQFVAAVLEHALTRGLVAANVSVGTERALPPQRVQHRAALTDNRARLADLVRALWGYGGSPVVAAAGRLIALTAVRPGELRGMAWGEIDLAAGEWRIPAERMKMGESHWVPLSSAAVAEIEALAPLTRHLGPLVLPSVRSPSRPLSENTLNAALRAMGFGKTEATAHGWRAVFSTAANESGWPADVIERALAHVPRDRVRAAYHRASYVAERRSLMAWWADCLAALRDGRPLPGRAPA